MDMAVVSIAGTKKGEWDEYSDTFDRMSAFELIDMDRFTENKDKDAADQPATAPE